MGWHLILVEDKRDSTPLDEVRPELEQMVRQDAIETYIQKLQEEAQISWTDSAEVAPATDDGHNHPPGQWGATWIPGEEILIKENSS